MNDERLDQIRRRLEAATPGPWYVRDRAQVSDVPDARIVEVFTLREADARICEVGSYSRRDGRANRACLADADFIAHAPGDIAFLLERIERLEAARSRDTARSTFWSGLREALLVFAGFVAGASTVERVRKRTYTEEEHGKGKGGLA